MHVDRQITKWHHSRYRQDKLIYMHAGCSRDLELGHLYYTYVPRYYLLVGQKTDCVAARAHLIFISALQGSWDSSGSGNT